MDWQCAKRSVTLPAARNDNTVTTFFKNQTWAPAFKKSSFEQYGIVRVRGYMQHNTATGLFCVIEFEDASVARKIVSDGYISINDERFEANPAVQVEFNPIPANRRKKVMMNIDDGIQQQSAHGSEFGRDVFNLYGLDGDCLIFILKKLNIPTLLTVAKVCVKFNTLAKDVFRRKYKTNQFRLCDLTSSNPIPLHQIEDFLKTFGSLIVRLYLGQENFHNFREYKLSDVLMQIHTNCENLKVLDMQKIFVNKKMSNELFPIFSRLESLKIKFSYSQSFDINQSFEDLLSACTQLTHLDVIHNRDNIDGVSENLIHSCVLPRLTSLVIETSNLEHLQLFLLSHLHLEDISIKLMFKNIPVYQVPHLVRFICDECVNVQKLSIILVSNENVVDIDLIQLSKLRRLRHLTLDINPNNELPMDSMALPFIQELLQKNIQLERLDFGHRFINVDTINMIAKMSSISSLTLMVDERYTTHNRLIILVKKLPNLDHLHIHTYRSLSVKIIDPLIIPVISYGAKLFKLRVDMCSKELYEIRDRYDDILEIVKMRTDKKKLTLILRGEWTNCPLIHTDTYFIEMKKQPTLLKIKVQVFCDNRGEKHRESSY